MFVFVKFSILCSLQFKSKLHHYHFHLSVMLRKNVLISNDCNVTTLIRLDITKVQLIWHSQHAGLFMLTKEIKTNLIYQKHLFPPQSSLNKERISLAILLMYLLIEHSWILQGRKIHLVDQLLPLETEKSSSFTHSSLRLQNILIDAQHLSAPQTEHCLHWIAVQATSEWKYTS